MKKTDSFQTSTPETVTISRAEYEELQAQSRRVSELEGRMNVLMEALRLAQRKRFGDATLLVLALTDAGLQYIIL